MESNELPVLRQIDVKRLEEFRGMVVAIDCATGEILTAAERLETLSQSMQERFSGRQYFAYGVPSILDFANASELRDR